MLCSLCFFGFLLMVAAAPKVQNQQLGSTRVEEATLHGYRIETHQVVTNDGYILKVYRIPYQRNQVTGPENRPVVFLMHGLFGLSQNFLTMGPELGLGYNLADAGFDVWMGNARGNINSRAHVTLNPDDEVDRRTFFDFSWEEIGMIDVPAMIDYALDYTGQQKLHYIGHSQGGTVFLVMGSMVPEYNEKLASVHLLAGVGYQEYFPDEQMKSLAQMTDLIYTIAQSQGLVEVTADLLAGLMPGSTRSHICLRNLTHTAMCDLIDFRHFTRNDGLEAVEFGGGALKQIAHYGQNIRDRLFRRYSYGTRTNEEVYGTSDPPLYDLGLITSNVTMHYSLNDYLLDERDVLAMEADMPHTVARKVARDSFEHSDYVFASDAKELVTDFIVDSIVEVHQRLQDEEIIPEVTESPSTGTDAATSVDLNAIFKMYLVTFLLMSAFYY